jgi:16S rRNA (adenine1518-N6/adenine1519-N6)-dimethyltransferase
MNPTEIKQVLQELGGGANKTLGQHFLIDRAALEAIVAAAMIEVGDQVLEIGPGLGVLTEALLRAGASVRAIEQDRRYIGYLEERFRSYGPRFRVIHGDASRLSWQEALDPGPWKLVSNLPYSITSLALRLGLWSPSLPERTVVLIQREVAERATSVATDGPTRTKGKTSLLSLMIALATTEQRIIKRVPAGAFFPPPRVESAILALAPMPWAVREQYWNISTEAVMQFAKKGFAHPRKFLSSNLELPVELIASLEQENLLPKGIRAEALSPAKWVALTRSIASKKEGSPQGVEKVV